MSIDASGTDATWIIGIDVGASGARARAVRDDCRVDVHGPGAVATARGAPAAITAVLDDAIARLGGAPVKAVAVGSTGLGTLGVALDELRADITARAGSTVVLAADAVTSHVGALAGAAGVTVAAGTGAITLAESIDGRMHRVDGWGHLLGDLGSGAWIGQQGLIAALQAFDGRDPSGRALLSAAITRFGAPLGWPSIFYGRDDRAAMLGTFAVDVLALAGDGDPSASAIATTAADALAEAALAGLRIPGVPQTVAITGGLFSSALLTERFASALVGLDLSPAAGSSLDGAVALARRRAHTSHGQSVPGLIAW